ncbi:HAD family hydrolase [Photobacterium indicum]|uniref:HAD family hydrolase n=1 Tax=Photobacterium indicum TaxID=81447 RepID=UPI003D0FB2E6
MNDKELFIFDMDGVLIDSEPFWRQAQIQVLKLHGAHINIDDCIEYTMGKRIDDIAKLWIDHFSLSLNTKKLSEEILDKTVYLIEQFGEAKEGIYELIQLLKRSNYRIALATSSSQPIITAVIDKLELNGIFELTLSADVVINGKPAPDVYLEVCNQMNVQPQNAIALEDSFNGVCAAVSAGITTIAIPEFYDDRFKIANYRLSYINEVLTLMRTNSFSYR